MRYGTTRQNMFRAQPLHRSLLLLRCSTQRFKCVFSGVLSVHPWGNLLFPIVDLGEQTSRERGGKYSDHIWNAPGLVMQKTERKSFTNKRKDGNGSRRNKKSAQTQDTWRKSVHYSLQQKETESLHEFDFKSVWDEILGARLRMFAQT